MTEIFLETKEKNFQTNENLDSNAVVIKDVQVYHESKELRRAVPIRNKEGKSYYVLTDYLEPGSIFSKSVVKKGFNGTKYVKYIFALSNPKEKISNNDTASFATNESQLSFGKSEKSKEPLMPSPGETTDNNSKILIQKINAFKRGLVNRIKYLMKIPDYDDGNTISMSAKTIKLNGSVLLSNIIEYQNMKNNFCFENLKKVFRHCRCKLLLRIDEIIITLKSVYLKINIVRVYPENIDVLDSTTKLTLLECLNTDTIKRMEKYSEMNHINKQRPSTKKEIRDELFKLLVVKK